MRQHIRMQGGPPAPCIGKRTRAEVESRPDRATEARLDAQQTQTPGRSTLVETQARRCRPIEGASANQPAEPAAASWPSGRPDPSSST